MRAWHTSIVGEPNPYRALPKVDDLARRIDASLPGTLIVEVARAAIDWARDRIAAGDDFDLDREVTRRVRALERGSGVEVINATGTLLHTNLGRARWSEESAARAAMAATAYTNLEIDLETGARGRRGDYVMALLRSLTGAEDTLVVNNNASALLLALAATSAGRAVPVSRGELIEIGGSYRLPSVMQASGARLTEVGTTNRTRIGDFETALQIHDCGAILKVHPSNYRIEGFTEEASLAELAGLAADHRLPLIYDIGSGLLDDETPWLRDPSPEWLRGEPAVRQSLAAGADLVLFSGDKLLAGPQAGIAVGRSDVVEQMRAHPLTRALRVDGPTLAGLAATLEAYADNQAERLPFWRQAGARTSEIESRAMVVATELGADTVTGESAVGAGSAPGMAIPTTLVVLNGEDHLFSELLAATRPVLCRREGGALVIDLRSVDPEDDETLIEIISQCR